MHYARISAAVLSFALVSISTASAGPISADVNLQYRPRLEIDKRFAPETGVFITHRARIGVGLGNEEWKVYIEPQDVRGWGSEANPTSYEANVDLHQGFAEWNPDGAFNLRIGRQSINHLNQRLIGGLNWAQQGRSFDAARLFGKIDNVSWDVWGAPLVDEAPRRARDGAVGAGLLQWDNAGRRAAVLGVGDMNREASLYRSTVGPHTSGKLFGSFIYQAEAYAQFGHRGGEEISAYMVNGELGYASKTLALKPSLRVGYDVLSGATEDTTAFDTLYGTNHAFYGYMDAFLNIPVHTGGRGLQDLYVKATVDIGASRAYLAVHHLRAGPGNDGTFGTEADLVVTTPLTSGVTWENGFAVLMADDAFAAVRPAAPDYPMWGYSMLTVAMK
jgi:hypothetical protein